jgi:hypothetical protein
MEREQVQLRAESAADSVVGDLQRAVSDAERWLAAGDDLRSGSVRRLTSTGGWTASDAWAEGSAVSPDGRSVADAWNSENGGAELRRADGAAGGPPGRGRDRVLAGRRLRRL